MIPPPPPYADEQAKMAREVAQVRAAGILGRTGQLSRLFDFLVGRSPEGTAPKESEIALEVFRRSGAFVAGEDAVVRVYIHRLRKKLEDFYKHEAASSEWRLTIPRGEYRLVLEGNRTDTGAAPTIGFGLAKFAWFRSTGVLICASVVISACAGWGIATIGRQLNDHDRTAFLDTSPWRAVARSQRPLLVVVGDYYIHGELDDGGNVRRLVREFSINSRDQLYQQMAGADASQSRVMDLGLSYLPTSAANALAQMAPLITHRRDVSVVTASSLTPQMMNDNDVLYIGYVSGMGEMLEPVFRGSKIYVGDSFDELRVRDSDARYISGGTRPSASRKIIMDYGYFSSFPGPNGNRITVLAGTRDVGLAGVSSAMVDRAILHSLPDMKSKDSIELLFEAEGAEGVVLTPNLVLTEHHDGTRLWTTGNRGAEAAAPDHLND